MPRAHRATTPGARPASRGPPPCDATNPRHRATSHAANRRRRRATPPPGRTARVRRTTALRADRSRVAAGRSIDHRVRPARRPDDRRGPRARRARRRDRCRACPPIGPRSDREHHHRLRPPPGQRLGQRLGHGLGCVAREPGFEPGFEPGWTRGSRRRCDHRTCVRHYGTAPSRTMGRMTHPPRTPACVRLSRNDGIRSRS